MNFLKGMAVGIATLVPGVSGGTMAIILGIYDDLIHAIGSFFKNSKKHMLFLFEVGIGAILGILFFSRLLENALIKYPYIMRFLFMGMIIGGLPMIYHKSRASGKRDIFDYIFLIAGFVIVLLMSFEPAAISAMVLSPGILNMLFLFAGGMVIAVALILPGISASFMLLVLGLYGVTLNAINTFNVPFLIPIMLGLVAGTLGTTRVIEKMLTRYPGKTYMLILGFVLGSLLSVFPGIPSDNQLMPSLLVLITGFLVMLFLGRKGIT